MVHKHKFKISSWLFSFDVWDSPSLRQIQLQKVYHGSSQKHVIKYLPVVLEKFYSCRI